MTVPAIHYLVSAHCSHQISLIASKQRQRDSQRADKKNIYIYIYIVTPLNFSNKSKKAISNYVGTYALYIYVQYTPSACIISSLIRICKILKCKPNYVSLLL